MPPNRHSTVGVRLVKGKWGRNPLRSGMEVKTKTECDTTIKEHQSQESAVIRFSNAQLWHLLFFSQPVNRISYLFSKAIYLHYEQITVSTCSNLLGRGHDDNNIVPVTNKNPVCLLLCVLIGNRMRIKQQNVVICYLLWGQTVLGTLINPTNEDSSGYIHG